MWKEKNASTYFTMAVAKKDKQVFSGPYFRKMAGEHTGHGRRNFQNYFKTTYLL